jgi:mannose-1-phosphate guanylyltransferase
MAEPLGLVEALILGAVQGATEFLPVSSDGHLAIGAMLLGATEATPLAFDVMLHAGTLLATLVVFRADICDLLRSLARAAREPRAWARDTDGRTILAVLAASVPTAAIGLLLEDAVEGWSTVPWIVGVCLLGSAAAVLATRFGRGRAETLGPGAALWVGVAQGLAVLPGLSRSGSTIAVAMLLGMSGPAAFRLSFLMSLPAVGGAVLLEARKVEQLAGVGVQAAAGATVAFAVGIGALLLLRGTVVRGKLWAFALYLVPLGLASIFYDLLLRRGAPEPRTPTTRPTMTNVNTDDRAPREARAALWAVVMAGGQGTRFWPLSRATRPKQFLPLGGGEEPLLRATVRRIAGLVPPERTLVVTGAALREATLRTLPELPPDNVLAEPVGRNTAPCVGWAAATVARRDPRGVLAVLAADHHIGDDARYRAVLLRAAAVARGGTLVTVGIVPTRPETGYGYLELGEPLRSSVGRESPRGGVGTGSGDEGGRDETSDDARGLHERSGDATPEVRRVVRFVEKPDRARAEEFLRSGRFLWNSGMFFFRADAVLAGLRAHLPELAAGLRELDVAAAAGREREAVERIYPTLPSVSIDVGLMEKANDVAVVHGDFGWSDVGSWTTAWELAPKDGAGNAVPDDAVVIDARGNLARARPGKVVALVGVTDLVVVDTDDALLVLPRDRAQDVRRVVEALRERGETGKL